MFIHAIYTLFISLSFAHFNNSQPQTVITDLNAARAIGGTVLAKDGPTGTAVTYLTQEQLYKLSLLNHQAGKCAGFEVLSPSEANQPALAISQLLQSHQKFQTAAWLSPLNIEHNDEYQALADSSNPERLKETVLWLSSYTSRYNKNPQPNQHVEDLKTKLADWLQDAKWPFSVELITHKSTQQKTLRLRITGSTRPSEIIVLGAHLDSINTSTFGGQGAAPGTDDNASGSSNLIEALKILKASAQPQRTIEFYWYAGEESGLLGSAEIAKESKNQQRDIISVLQLDMTLYPGSGEQKIGLLTDFTSPWLRELFKMINNSYIHASFIEDTCGYGCSDHASWFRQGFHAVIPFEATLNTMNKAIHTSNDLLGPKTSFTHSNTFTKFAILYTLILGNSDLRPPN
jgi:leucyl aminopeptidase